jgi:hypothetical protein
MDMKNDKVLVRLELSREEYKSLNQSTRSLLLLPTQADDLCEPLTTGKLGNSNRIMLPNKVLHKYNVTNVLKKAPSRVFDMGGEKFLLIKLQESMVGRPIFGGSA